MQSSLYGGGRSWRNGARARGGDCVYTHCAQKFLIMATREPLPRRSHAAVGVGSKLYVWGGDGSGSTIRTTALEIFDVPSVTWEEPRVLQGSDVPDGLADMAATTDGETSYFFGGRTGSSQPYTYHNSLFQFSPSQLQCQRLEPTSPSHKVPRKTSASCIVQFKDKLVLHGGFTGQRQTSELHVFDLRNSECKLWY